MSCIKYAKENNLNNVLIFGMIYTFVGGINKDFKKIVDTLSTQDWKLFFFGGTIDRKDNDPPFDKISEELYKSIFFVWYKFVCSSFI